MCSKEFIQQNKLEGRLTAAELVDRLLFESPRDIDSVDFGLSDPIKEARLVYDLNRDSRTNVIGTYAGLELKKCGHTIFVMSDTRRLLYFVKFVDKSYSALRGRHVTQIAVWRRAGTPSGLAKHVFWEYLFPIHCTIMTDSMQTAQGRYFWGDRVQEALQSGHLVYRVNVLKRERSPIRSFDEFEAWRRTVYGAEDKHEQERVIITDNPLPP